MLTLGLEGHRTLPAFIAGSNPNDALLPFSLPSVPCVGGLGLLCSQAFEISLLPSDQQQPAIAGAVRLERAARIAAVVEEACVPPVVAKERGNTQNEPTSSEP